MVDCKIGMKYCIQISCHADGKIDILWTSQRGTTQSLHCIECFIPVSDCQDKVTSCRN